MSEQTGQPHRIFSAAARWAIQEQRESKAVRVPVKVIATLWAARGIIGNGGMQAFYESMLNAKDFAWALSRIGLRELSDAVERADHEFSDGAPPTDFEQRLAALNKIAPMGRVRWRAIEEMLFRRRDFEERAATFVLRHLSVFDECEELDEVLR